MNTQSTFIIPLIIGLIISVAATAVVIAAMWKLFTKAGRQGWKALIPIVNVYVLFDICWDGGIGILYLALPILINLARYLGAMPALAWALIILMALAELIITVIFCVKLSRVFDHGFGFALGLIFLFPIFMAILGFGKSRYIGMHELALRDDAAPKRHMGQRAANTASNTAIYILLILISVIWLLPFIFIVLQSFRVELRGPVGYVVPHTWGLDNYSRLLTSNFKKWYLNTFIIALVVAVMQTIIVLCMSYTLSRFRFKMRGPLMRFMLILGMFPGMLTMIILYRVLKDLGMTQANAVPGLILVYIASSGMGYYVSKGFFDTIPKSLDEAARVDGATRSQVLTKIILPLAKPIVIYTILTAFMAPWGDFVFARYVAFGTSSGYNVAVGMYDWLNKDQIGQWYTTFCAGGVVVALPVAVLFMCLQKYYVEGVTGGAVKG